MSHSSSVCQSENFVWYDDELLGVGAVGEVYKGQCVKTGEQVAVKVMKRFDKNTTDHLINLQERELEVLRKLNHPNIVKLIAVENEINKPGKKVIVMELCSGGNLYDIITKPENVFGLHDEEFLKVLHGIGWPIYKLIDFGAARELHTEEEFQSIYGTDEYLDPGLYEKAFMDRGSTSTFTGSVDLWSIGATLYHVAAGQLPFQAYHGRRDKNTMYKIIANKESGDISGIQSKPNGPIVYDKHLPKNCLLSRGLRPPVEELLAHLLEADKEKTMSFEKFFVMAECIVKKKFRNLPEPPTRTMPPLPAKRSDAPLREFELLRAVWAGQQTIRHYLTRKFDNMATRKEHVTDMHQSYSDRLQTSSLLVSCMEALNNGTNHNQSIDSLNSGRVTYERQRNFINRLSSEIQELTCTSHNTEEMMKKCVDVWMVERPACKEEDCCSTRMDMMVRDVEEIESGCKRERVPERGLSGTMSKKSELNRRTISNHCLTAKTLIEQHCQKNTGELFKLFREFMCQSWQVMENLDKLEQGLESSSRQFKVLSQNFNTSDSRRKSFLKRPDSTNDISEAMDNPSSPSTPPNNNNHSSTSSAKLKKVHSKSNLEKSLMRKMLSITFNNSPDIKKDILPLAEENLSIIKELRNKMNLVARINSEKTYIEQDGVVGGSGNSPQPDCNDIGQRLDGL
ncbi:hypothetical protein HELRODRAFT_193700 [Helobdella robusta]|uniref:Protein kinase domain-containing protein n=1 Tax=Helobdella robusta TaxID=6412 RepID=T1FV99_HELRO|nr:hypothetical protein HELRODRAFT_193700 [Helobdella robusta]ESN95010.1 hypothetical protein HELRODRAFT_193700 [Helobdella robusta]